VLQGAGAASRFAKPQGGGLSMEAGGGRRPSASLCGKTVGFAERNKNPDRCFRESRRHPRAQSKLFIQEQMPKVKGCKKIAAEFILDKFLPIIYSVIVFISPSRY
jgi:hypothetical protein